MPVYPETEGITSKYLRFLLKPLVTALEIQDTTPEPILKKYDAIKIDGTREIKRIAEDILKNLR